MSLITFCKLYVKQLTLLKQQIKQNQLKPRLYRLKPIKL